ncbi:integrase core domain-containing protein [Acidimicrobium ferrooxidans]|uniref:integrase core domain-containing protein n=1 Tax=Acidimicrobium ferrooxidans TaxID=53635 RepID=UPI003CCB1296
MASFAVWTRSRLRGEYQPLSLDHGLRVRGARQWRTGAATTQTGTVVIDPGSPWQNAWIESFNGRMRDGHLNPNRFDSLLEATVLRPRLEERRQLDQASECAWLGQSRAVRKGLAREA